MDDVDMDHIVEVPDTPDRLISQRRNCNSLSSFTGLVEIPDSVDRVSHHLPNGRSRTENGIGQNRRLSIRPPKRIGTGPVNCSDPIIISPSDNSSTSQGHLSRRLKIDRNAQNEVRRSFGALDLDGVGAASSGSSSQSFDRPEKGPAVNLMGKYGEDLQFLPKSVQTFSKLSKGEEKPNGSTCKATRSSMVRGKEIDLSSVSIDESPENVPQLSRSVSSPRLAGHRRLVRNGCISPHNIASKAKDLTVRDGPSSSRLSQVGDEVFNGSRTCNHLDEIVSEVGNYGRAKGKGILVHPSTSKDRDTSLFNMTSRNYTLGSSEQYKRTVNAAGNVLDGCESQGGWRSTRNQLRSSRTGTAANSCENVAEKINNHYESKSGSRSNHADDRAASSRHVSDANRVNELQHLASPIRRLNRRTTIPRGDSGSSRVDPRDSNNILADTSQESPDSSSFRVQNRRQRQALDSVIEISESSPEMRYSSPLVVDTMGSPVLDARARQVEADEMLARELQEQLYNETPTDEYVVQMLQQMEQNHASSTSTSTSTSSRRPSSTRGSTVTRSQRLLLPRSTQTFAHRRGRNNNVVTRAQPSRRSGFRRSSTLLSRERGVQFPLDMDLDMRIDILEALENAIGDFDDIPTFGNRTLRMEQDFNLNDYEMLLALDENVHRVGTSSNQINSLPESKVQADVSDETCAICLDNPKFGETIRHLPCLHKFHKDCIDPWLSRSTSCPVCKSSVT